LGPTDVSSLVIVTVTVDGEFGRELFGPVRKILNVSLLSTNTSLVMKTVKLLLVSPGANWRLPRAA